MKDETEQAPVRPTWTGPQIVLAFFLSLLAQSLVYLLFDYSGWFRWCYGEEWKATLKAGGEVARLLSMRLSLWVGALASVVQVTLVLAYFRHASGSFPRDFGLTTMRLGRNAAAGLLFAVIFAPGAYGIQGLALWGMKLLGVEEQSHPFTLLGNEGLSPAEWALLIVSAVALAPLWEELLYRGIIQPWVISRQPYGGPAALAAAMAFALAMRSEMFAVALRRGGREVLIELMPFACLAALVLVYLVVNRRSAVAGGLFASAVLFGWIHASVWPSPVALVWLGLGLGWLRWKTGSLVGPIVLHAVFNAIACAMLLWWKPPL